MIRPGATIKPLIRLPKSPDACVEWIGARNEEGRPVKCVNGVNLSAARWVWEMLFGVLPKELQVIQRCGNGGCVNLFHLRAVSRNEVQQESKSSLTPGDVVDIRRKAIDGGVPHDLLAKDYDVHPSTITKIVRRQRWATPKKANA